MLKLIGILKREDVREFVRKDGSEGISRTLYIEPEGSIYPIKVNTSDTETKFGRQGEKISLDVEIFPYFIKDGKRQRAFLDVYIPNKK